MYNKINRDNNYISSIKDFISENYEFTPTDITPASRGFFGETWVVSASEKKYFLKLDYSATHKTIYAESFATIDFMTQNGIKFIPKIIKSKSGHLYLDFDDAIFGIFEWVSGENLENDETKIHEYKMLAEIYSLPTHSFGGYREDFSCDCIAILDNLLIKLRACEDDNAKKVLDVIKSKDDTIAYRKKRLKLFSNRAIKLDPPKFITHGDPGGNLMTDGENYMLIDWDAPFIAPCERDAWFASLRNDYMRKHFDECLHEKGINYSINNDIMAYYCYYSALYFLCEYLRVFFEMPNMRDILPSELEGYFNCWIEDNIAIVDKFK